MPTGKRGHRRRFGTIRTRLLVAFVLLVLLPAVAISISAVLVGFANGKEQAFQKLDAVAALKGTEVKRWLQNLQTDLLGLVEEVVFRRAAQLMAEGAATDEHQPERGMILNRLAQVIEMTKRHDELFIISRQGMVVLSTEPLKVHEFRGLQPYFKEGLKHAGVHVQTVAYSSASEKLNTIVAVQPIRDERGKAVGVLCGQAKLRMLNSLMGERTGLGRSGETCLVGSNHVLMTVSRFPTFTPGMTLIHTPGTDAALDEQRSDRGLDVDYRGVPVIAVFHWLPELKAMLLAKQDQVEAFQPIHTTLTLNATVAAVAVLFAGLAALLFARGISSPLTELAGTASQIARGNLDLTAEVGSRDEIGSLALAFNAMTERLRHRLAMEKLAANMSREFIDIPAYDTDWAIEGALRDIAVFAGGDRSYVFLFSEDGESMSITHEWCGRDICSHTPGFRKLSAGSHPWFFEKISKFETVHVPSVPDLPPEADAEREEWLSKGVQSLLCVPMVYGKSLRGFVGFDSFGKRRAWSEEDSQLLCMVGEIFCSTLERKWSEQKLEDQKERLAVTLRSIGDGVITTDVDGRVVLMNKVAELLTGRTQEEAAGMPLSEVFRITDEKTGERCPSPAERAAGAGAVVTLANNTLLEAKDGTRRVIADSGAPILDREGKIIGVVLVFRDITEKRKMQEELQESEEKFRNLFESAPDGILITTFDGKIISFNNALMNILKVETRDALAGLNIRELYEKAEDRSELLAKMTEKGRMKDFRLRFRDNHGRVFPASLSLTMIHYEGQQCIQTIMRDITAIEKMEEDLKRYAENLQKMVDEKTAELRSANEALSATIRTLEQTRERLALSAHQAGMAEIASSVLHNIGNAVTPVNVRVHRLSEIMQPHEIRGLEKVRGLLLSEIADPELSETERERKEDLLSFLSTTTEILKIKNENLKDDLEAIGKGLSHITEIIALQQKYAGLRGMETRVNVNDLIMDSLDMLMDSLVKRGIKVKHDLEKLPDTLLDRNKTIQILINIIKNAYEAIDMAPPENKKEIFVSTAVDSDGFIRVVIADSGVGLSPEIREQAFGISFSTKGKGTGFGLHDAANYIRAQQGFIDLLSDGPGKGARIVLRLPIIEGASQ